MIVFTKETLREALNGLRVLKLNKQAMPFLQHVLIHGFESVVWFDGTDLDQYLRYEGPGSCTNPNRVLVPYETLANAAKQADPGGEVRVQTDTEPNISYPVSGSLISVPFAFLDLAEFPPKPVPAGEAITLPAGVVGSMREALGCASQDSSRYVLNSVYLDQHAVVATDGRQLYRSNSLNLPLTKGVIFPRSGVPDILPDTEAEFRLWTDHNRELAQISTGPWRWITKLVDGNYPNYSQAIPRLDSYTALVHLAESDVARLRSVVPKLPGFKELHSTVVLSISSEKGAVLKTTPKHPKVHVALDRSDVVCPAPVEIGFNAKFLLGALDTGMRELRVRDPQSPLLLLAESRLQMWMPIDLRVVGAVPATAAQPAKAEAAPTVEPGAPESSALATPSSDQSSESPAPVVPVEVVSTETASSPKPVREVNVTHTQTHNPPTTMVAPATNTTTQPAREIREDAAPGAVASRIPPAPAQPATVADAINARLVRLRDLLREAGNEFTNIQNLVKEQQRSYRVLERDHEALKKNIRALREVPV